MNADDEEGAVPSPSLAQFVEANIEAMAFPPSEWEARTLAELVEFDQVLVTRPHTDRLLAEGMMPNHCHVNCAFQTERYPRHVRHVTGWIVLDYSLVLHSVIEVQGQWICVTPQTTPQPSQFSFIPDRQIEWVSTGEYTKSPMRNGVEVTPILRKYPELHVRMRNQFRSLVASGIETLAARQMVEENLGPELQAMPKIE